jgi:thiol-disulfide isomerase/thioredoxin
MISTLAVAIIFGLTQQSQAVSKIPILKGDLVPSFGGKDFTGKSFEFPKDFKDKIVLLDVWATWCKPCVSEMPHMQGLFDRYKKDGFEILGICLDEPGKESSVQAVLDKQGAKWRQWYEAKGWNDSPIRKALGVSSVPRLFLVDGSTGKVVETEPRLRGEALTLTLAKLFDD